MPRVALPSVEQLRYISLLALSLTFALSRKRSSNQPFQQLTPYDD
jgi:hypothetical protein